MIERFLECLLLSLSVGLATSQLSILNPSSRSPNPPPLRTSGIGGGGGEAGSLSQRGFHALRPLEDPKVVTPVVPGNISCYTCKIDFRKKEYDKNHPCLGRHDGQTVDKDLLVNCGVNDRYCRAERTEVNGILITLTRECIDICYYGCRPKGFGISYESCAECCTTDACNDMYPISGSSAIAFSLFSLFSTWSLLALHHWNNLLT